MRVLIVCASRYGSTLVIGGWIKERLGYEGIEADLKNAGEDISIEDYDLIIIGSGIYNHGVLPELKSLVGLGKDLLRRKKIAIFGVAMRTTPVFNGGKIRGGLEHLTPQMETLKESIIHAGMLHGEMVLCKLTDQDKDGILKFYKMLNLSDEELRRRLLPRTLMDKKEVWEFAETVINKAK